MTEKKGRKKGTKFSASHIEMVRLTLDKVADADVIAILNAMPSGSKARTVAQALRVACRVVGGKTEIVQPTSATYVRDVAPAAKAIDTPAESKIVVRKPVALDVPTSY